MNILYHHRTRGRKVEGVHIRGVIDALRGLGHRVSVLSFPGADPETEVADGPSASAGQGAGESLASRLLTHMPEVVFELLELVYNLLTLVRLPRALARDNATLIYERYSLFLCAGVWLARRRGVPIILEINDSALVERVRPLRMKGMARRIERWCFTHATGLVFISGAFEAQAREAYGALAPSIISPNAADPVLFDPARFNRAALRAERGIQGTVCGYVGAFAHWHGTAGFIAGVLQRLDEVPGLTLLLVGDGRDLPAVRAHVEAQGLGDRVILPGRVAHGEIASWIACMDYALLPNSNVYGSPMKVFEFMAMGVGVVAPDYGPLREVIDDGRTGWLFAHGQVDACVSTVLRLAGQGDACASVGRAARDYIVEQRQWRHNAEQLLTLLPVSAAR